MLMKIFPANSHESQYLASIVVENKNTITYSRNRDAKHAMGSRRIQRQRKELKRLTHPIFKHTNLIKVSFNEGFLKIYDAEFSFFYAN